MSTDAGTVTDGHDPMLVCWCCAEEFPERGLVRLGAHPEVGICPDCVRGLHRRAVAREAEDRGSRRAVVMAATQRVREWVVDRGWHRRPLIGPLLERLGRYLP